MSTIDAAKLTTRELNAELRRLVGDGADTIEVLNPAARHNLGVALSGDTSIAYRGPAGYFCGALGRGLTTAVHGNSGWSTGADMMDGLITVDGNSGSSTGASMRGGAVVVHGDAGPRTGIAMKGGTVVVEGSTGYMTGFLMQRGTVVVCGDAADAFGDSMYQGKLFCGGNIRGLGADTEVGEPDDEELAWLRSTLEGHGIDADRPWQRVVSGGRLWRFDKREFAVWREAL
jgi:glutamate synthase domain-containing protein 3